MSRWWSKRREVIGESDAEAVAIMQWAVDVSGVAPAELARRLGWKRQSVDMYLKGRRPNVGWNTALRWFRACGFRVILNGEGAPE